LRNDDQDAKFILWREAPVTIEVEGVIVELRIASLASVHFCV
jgi:hypothetical protein